ncbi:hypothetical protein EVAR_96144_1 [Eumeta japonica]|uniref:Uncharacterized protein n=1 Tax=Eumeta variegata TaxID=151549 RepID=A0A4C1VJH4_EUMVA|nr:hypothetical protein EVAR_96144_1 [Eumeta japonica]
MLHENFLHWRMKTNRGTLTSTCHCLSANRLMLLDSDLPAVPRQAILIPFRTLNTLLSAAPVRHAAVALADRRSLSRCGWQAVANIPFVDAYEHYSNAIDVVPSFVESFKKDIDESLKKLHHYEVTGRAFDLLASYLTNSVQKVDINNMRSSGSVVRMGVLQGSILALQNTFRWRPRPNVFLCVCVKNRLRTYRRERRRTLVALLGFGALPV